MLRFPVLAVVLTLGVGPNAAALCRAWCDADPPQACHRELASPTAVAGDCCDLRATSPTMVLSSDARHGVALLKAAQAAPWYHVAVSPADARLRDGHRPRRSCDTRLATVLRI